MFSLYFKVIIFYCFLSYPFFCYANGKALVFGVHPYLPALELQKRFTPLRDYLSEKLSQSIKISISPSYKEHIDKILQGNIDIAYMGPIPYAKVKYKIRT